MQFGGLAHAEVMESLRVVGKHLVPRVDGAD